MADAQRFYVDIERETAAWMRAHLRTRGFVGAMTAYNNWLSPAAHRSRGQFEWVDMHNYFTEPVGDSHQGMVVRQGSMLGEGAAYIRDLASARHAGRAFTASEYGQPFWNRHRRETVLALPAYAALQRWGMVCQHSGAVTLSYGLSGFRPILQPFAIGQDPIARAGEVAATLLFQRGDVAGSRSLLSLRMPDDYVFERNGSLSGLPGNVSRLALVTGLGLDGGSAGNTVDAYIDPDSAVLTERAGRTRPVFPPGKSSWVHGVTLPAPPSDAPPPESMRDARWPQRLQALRQAGLLASDNLSDAARGLYHSDTGQVLLDSRNSQLAVVTPLSEGASVERFTPVRLGVLRIEAADTPFTVLLSSRDEQALSHSRRMLVTLVTDARNSDMRFSDSTESKLLALGGTPALLQAASVRLRLATEHAASLKVYSVDLRGRRKDALAVERDADGMSFVLNLRTLSHGPTTFFEIAE